ncbi:syntaxin-8 [Bacillus rossius redtenbacheri]|uniref:syntaxin-8 n=1 Tax=Bacillus rossius redtenbacheri TaxID=93214 RepID=UPI002FDD03D8
MALVYVDSDPWLTEYDACEKLLREIKEKIAARNLQPKTSQEYGSLSSSIRMRMKQYEVEVKQLRNKLASLSASQTITSQEAERRMRQVEQLESQQIQIQRLFIDREPGSSLMQRPGRVFADVGSTGWGLDHVDEDERTQSEQHMSVDQLQQQQRRLLQDQEQGLEVLSSVISRQKEIAQTIGNEVDLQNEIIDDLAEYIDRTDTRLLDETQQIKIIDRKDRTCWYWVVIIVLFVSIVIVAIV